MSEEKRSELIVKPVVPREPPEGGWPTLPQITREDLAAYIVANPGALPEIMSREEWEDWQGGVAGWIDDGGIERLKGLYQLPDGAVVILGPDAIILPTSSDQQKQKRSRRQGNSNLLTVAEAAELRRVSEGTIRNWIEWGLLPKVQTLKKGAIGIRLVDLLKVRAKEDEGNA